MQLVCFDFVVARNMESVRRRPKPGFDGAANRLPLPDLSPRLMIAAGAKLRRRFDLIAPLLDGTRSPRAVIVEPLGGPTASTA